MFYGHLQLFKHSPYIADDILNLLQAEQPKGTKAYAIVNKKGKIKINKLWELEIYPYLSTAQENLRGNREIWDTKGEAIKKVNIQILWERKKSAKIVEKKQHITL